MTKGEGAVKSAMILPVGDGECDGLIEDETGLGGDAIVENVVLPLLAVLEPAGCADLSGSTVDASRAALWNINSDPNTRLTGCTFQMGA